MEPMTIIESGSDSDSYNLKPVTGCKRVEVSRGVSFTFFFLGFLTCIVAFGTPYWYVKGDYSFGLWNECDRDFFTDTIECMRINVGRPSQLSFKMRALQAQMFLGLLGNIIAFILYMAWFCKKIRKGSLAYITMGIHAFAGVTQVTAVALFADYYAYDLSVLGWSFIVATVGGGIQSLTGIITLFVLPFVR